METPATQQSETRCSLEYRTTRTQFAAYFGEATLITNSADTVVGLYGNERYLNDDEDETPNDLPARWLPFRRASRPTRKAS